MKRSCAIPARWNPVLEYRPGGGLGKPRTSGPCIEKIRLPNGVGAINSSCRGKPRRNSLQARGPRTHKMSPRGNAMPISRRTLLTTLAATPLTSLLPRPAFAAYTDKPIRLIVPFAAGGNADLVARLVAEGMSPSLGQTIVVESRAGAGGSLGAAAVATSPPDGYTLLTGSNGPLTVNPFVQAKLSYDPLKDFIAIGLANLAPHSIVLHVSV